MKNKAKIIVDILMYADFLILMNEGVIRNLKLHGILGIILFCLFILHHILNFWFYKSLLKGKWNVNRIILNITDWILFILMILMAVSSVMMSGFVFELSTVQITQVGRILHLMSSSWSFIFISFHLGLHSDSVLRKIENGCSKLKKILLFIILFLFSFTGFFCFIKTQLYVFMFNTGRWKIAAPDVLTGILEYIGITVGICCLERIIRIIIYTINGVRK